mmetsp:Transcript_4058/g.7224  ORF Transcript_4058/g.7224 Transcript_4058/m.7224 type:complete len:623 (-) Transcript_4058:687-2555(-)
MAGDPDVEYLTKNGVPDLINDLVATLADKGVLERPDSVHDFCCEWLKSKRSEVALVDLEKVPTTPIEGQKTGTSGLRKKVAVFKQPHYLENWVQSLFRALAQTEPEFLGCTLVLGGDGRYWSEEAIQTIIKMAFANGVKTLIVGQNGLLATPAVSALIRKEKALGGIIMTASHNPGGPDDDWGIKYNRRNGEPAPENLTDIIYAETKSISSYVTKKMPPIDISKLASYNVAGGHKVHVVSSSEGYLELMKEIFDFDKLRKFCQRADFSFVLDCMNGVAGAAATALIDELECPKSVLMNNKPKPDFGGLHPDPNLKYAEALVDIMYGRAGRPPPDFGAAFDGDADRNMILGRHFFITPSDSVAIIAHYAQKCIPFFQANGIQGLARSMPTATSLDRVAAKLGVPIYEVPTGWKFFCNLMDADQCSICGEESFGTGSRHIREKDGLWAVLAWLSILEYCNPEGGPGKSVQDIAEDFWREYGRSLYCRYDYEGIEATTGQTNPAETMMAGLNALTVSGGLKGRTLGAYKVQEMDNFAYSDPVDGSVAAGQGIRILFTDGSRIIFRLSGTGSSGATIRLYMEKVQAPDVVDLSIASPEACKDLAKIALEVSNLVGLTGRDEPTVIT